MAADGNGSSPRGNSTKHLPEYRFESCPDYKINNK